MVLFKFKNKISDYEFFIIIIVCYTYTECIEKAVARRVQGIG